MTDNKSFSAAFLTLGCKVNYYETEKMIEQFQQRGFQIKEFSEKADIYVVNTCTVTNIADRKSRQMLHRAKKMNPDSLVIAVGCYVESAGEKILEDMSVDAAFSNQEKESLPDRIIEKFKLHTIEKEDAALAEHRKGRTRAYLKIQDGCNQFCSYCLIPYVRGRGVLTSTPADEVAERVNNLVKQGYKEVVMTGIHLSSYGIDRSEEINFVKLQGRPLLEVIKKVSEIPGLERIRLGSLEPRIISESFLEELVKVKKICPHFHLSLQSGCDSVLKRMNRHYTTAEYAERVELLRKFFENPAITTDVIVGFPGETDEEFEQTRTYLEQIRLADIHVFKYSPRSGTMAAEMKNQVAPEQKNARSDKLLADAGVYHREYEEAFLDKEESVLFEEVVCRDGDAWLTGHNERYVKIGVPVKKAQELGYRENEIFKVKVTKVLF
jgi:threonylcarbamoyladenosine tRNA methylthiotransferase MtaB